MKINMVINNIKSINTLEVSLPIERGLYAITGQNGSGKSTLVMCASTVFFNMPMNEYFGATDQDASISFELDGAKRSWTKTEKGRWVSQYTGVMYIKGFYEGSIIFGNRFKNTSLRALKQLDRIERGRMKPAPEFIRENLGLILHNSEKYYDKLFSVTRNDVGSDVDFKGELFYYEKDGHRVSQLHMSTGENLLTSILNSIYIRNNDRASLKKPCIMFLDEIELALHPSSLKRLVYFLKKVSIEMNYAIYFSTHSIELIGSIVPDNIFFLERHADGTVEILNPCYPAYATRILYDHAGYDYIFLVEDDLAKEIIGRLLRDNKLLSHKLIHVLPCGGYTNVLDLAQEVVESNLVGKNSCISVILDGDVQDSAKQYMVKRGILNNLSVNYLPIESLEKYLKSNLVDAVDHKLFRHLNDFVFHQVSLRDIIDKYCKDVDPANDANGKKLYKRIDDELRNRNKTRSDLVEIVVGYLFDSNSQELNSIVEYLRVRLGA